MSNQEKINLLIHEHDLTRASLKQARFELWEKEELPNLLKLEGKIFLEQNKGFTRYTSITNVERARGEGRNRPYVLISGNQMMITNKGRKLDMTTITSDSVNKLHYRFNPCNEVTKGQYDQALEDSLKVIRSWTGDAR